jgi:hypothetical protein
VFRKVAKVLLPAYGLMEADQQSLLVRKKKGQPKLPFDKDKR